MKFWQLLTIFREENDLLENELKTPKGLSYQNHYLKRKEIVLTQNREILDSHVDNYFLTQICLKSSKVFFYSSKMKILFSYHSGYADQTIPMADAINLFDHDVIAETVEKSECQVSWKSNHIS